MSKPPLIFVIVMLAIAVLAIRQYRNQQREAARNDAAPVRTVPVKVTAIRTVLWPDRHSRQREVVPLEEKRYQVTLQPLNGEPTLTFLLRDAQPFRPSHAGQQGWLTVQGSRFIAFHESETPPVAAPAP